MEGFKPEKNDAETSGRGINRRNLIIGAAAAGGLIAGGKAVELIGNKMEYDQKVEELFKEYVREELPGELFESISAEYTNSVAQAYEQLTKHDTKSNLVNIKEAMQNNSTAMDVESIIKYLESRSERIAGAIKITREFQERMGGGYPYAVLWVLEDFLGYVVSIADDIEFDPTIEQSWGIGFDGKMGWQTKQGKKNVIPEADRPAFDAAVAIAESTRLKLLKITRTLRADAESDVAEQNA